MIPVTTHGTAKISLASHHPPNVLQNQTSYNQNEFHPGSKESDFLYDQVLYKLSKNKLTDQSGINAAWAREWGVPPQFSQKQINGLKTYLEQPVPYFIYFDILAIHETKAKFKHLPQFLSTPLMSQKAYDLPFSLCPGDYYRKILAYIQSFYDGPVLIELLGGHARQFLYGTQGENWGEAYFNSVTGNLEIPAGKILERFQKNAPDSDCRFLVPNATPDQIGLFCRYVIDLIVELIQKNETYANPEFKEPLKWLIENHGLEKLWWTPPDDVDAKNIYGAVSFNRKAKSLETLFVKKMDRACIFYFDAYKIPITELVRNKNADGLFILPYSTNNKQSLADAFTYALHCPHPTTADEYVFFCGLMHQIKGGRYTDLETEFILLEKVLERCKTSNQKAKKKYDGKLAVIALQKLLSKYFLDHGKNDALTFVAFVLRLFCVLKKYEQDIPVNVSGELWKVIQPQLKTFTKSEHFSRSLLFKNLYEIALTDALDIDTTLFLLQIFSLIKLNTDPTSDNNSSRVKAYVTSDGGKPAVLLENGLCFTFTPNFNRLLQEFTKRIAGKPVAAIQKIFTLFKPETVFNYTGSTALKDYYKHLDIDPAILEKCAIEFLENELPLVKQMGFYFLCLCYDLSYSDVVPKLLEHLPEILAAESDAISFELYLNHVESLLIDQKIINPNRLIFTATRELAREKKLTPQVIMSKLFEDLFQTQLSKLSAAIWPLFCKYFPLQSPSEQKAYAIKLLNDFKHQHDFTLQLFQHLRIKKILNNEELCTHFDPICKALKNKKQNLLALQNEALEIVQSRPKPADKKSKEAPRQIREIPDLAVKLIEDKNPSAAHELLTAAIKGLFISQGEELERTWILLTYSYLQDETPVPVLDCWKEGQEIGAIKKACENEQVDLLLGIVNKLFDSQDKAFIELANTYIKTLSSMQISEKIKEQIKDRVNAQIKTYAVDNNWDALIVQIDKRYSSVIGEESSNKHKLDALSYKIHQENPVNYGSCIALALQLLRSKCDRETLLSLIQLLIEKLTNPDEISSLNDRLSLAFDFISKSDVGSKEKQNFIRNYIKGSLAGELKHLINGCNFFLNLINSRQEIQEGEFRDGVSLILKIFSTKSSYAANLPQNLLPLYDTLIEWCRKFAMPDQIVELTGCLIDARLNLEFNPIRWQSLLWASQALLNTPRVAKLQDIFCALKWFVIPHYAEEQKGLYELFITRLLEDSDLQNAMRWINRIANISGSIYDVPLYFEWIKKFVENRDLKSAHDLLDKIKNQNQKNKDLLATHIWELLWLFKEKNYAQLAGILLQNGSLFHRLSPKNVDHKLVKEVINDIYQIPVDIQNFRNILKLLTDYGIDEKIIFEEFIIKVKGAPSFELFELVQQHQDKFVAALGKSKWCSFWLTTAEKPLEPLDKHLEFILEILKNDGDYLSAIILLILEKHWANLSQNGKVQIAKFILNSLMQRSLLEFDFGSMAIKKFILSDIESLTPLCATPFLDYSWPPADLYELLPILIRSAKNIRESTLKEIVHRITVLFAPTVYDAGKFQKLHQALFFESNAYFHIANLLLFYFDRLLSSASTIQSTLTTICKNKYFPQIINILDLPKVRSSMNPDEYSELRANVSFNINANNCFEPPKLQDLLLSIDLTLDSPKPKVLLWEKEFNAARMDKNYSDTTLFMHWFLKSCFVLKNPLLTYYYLYRVLERNLGANLRKWMPDEILSCKTEFVLFHQKYNALELENCKVIDLDENKENILNDLIGPLKWTKTFQNLISFEEQDLSDLPTLHLFPKGAIEAINLATENEPKKFYDYFFDMLKCVVKVKSDSFSNSLTLISIAYSSLMQIFSRGPFPQVADFFLTLNQFIFWENLENPQAFMIHQKLLTNLMNYMCQREDLRSYVQFNTKLLIHTGKMERLVAMPHLFNDDVNVFSLYHDMNVATYAVHSITVFENVIKNLQITADNYALISKIVVSTTLAHSFIPLDLTVDHQNTLVASMKSPESALVKKEIAYLFEVVHDVLMRNLFQQYSNVIKRNWNYLEIVKVWTFTLTAIVQRNIHHFTIISNTSFKPATPDQRPYKLAKALFELYMTVAKQNELTFNQKISIYTIILTAIYEIFDVIDLGCEITKLLDIFDIKSLIHETVPKDKDTTNLVILWFTILTKLRDKAVHNLSKADSDLLPPGFNESIISIEDLAELTIPKLNQTSSLFRTHVVLKARLQTELHEIIKMISKDPAIYKKFLSEIKLNQIQGTHPDQDQILRSRIVNQFLMFLDKKGTKGT